MADLGVRGTNTGSRSRADPLAAKTTPTLHIPQLASQAMPIDIVRCTEFLLRLGTLLL
jgi:hypothetical protein